VPDSGGWAVKKNGGSAASSVYKTQGDAIGAARRVAKKTKGQVVVHGRDGRIRDVRNYGNDPRLPELPFRETKVGTRRIREAVWTVTKRIEG
jgi:hypothetical protein